MIGDTTAGIIGTIPGTVIGAFLGYWFSRKSATEQRKFEAGAKFVQSFMEVKRLCELKEKEDSRPVFLITDNSIPHQYGFFLVYSQFLDKHTCVGIRDAREEYTSKVYRNNDSYGDELGIYPGNEIRGLSEDEKRARVLSRVNKIITNINLK